MALLSKTNPIGIDAVIHKIQTKLYNSLTAKWNVQLNGYPRCYVLEEKNERTIEYFDGKNDYSGNLIVAEKNKFFFTAENDYSKLDNLNYQTNVSLYFILDVAHIYPAIKHRCDAEVLADVMSELGKCPGLLQKNSVVTDYKKVFQGFRMDIKTNMQPYYCFRIDLTLSVFKIDQKVCFNN